LVPIVQCDAGGWSIGWRDDAPAFLSWRFAAAVAAARREVRR